MNLKRPLVVMKCDHAGGCLRQVRRAPRIVIPAAPPILPGHRPIKVMTTLHYCDEHAHEFDPREWLTDRNKKRVEQTGRLMRAFGFRPDFDAVRVELVPVTTPEYRAFLNHVGLQECFG